MPKISALGGMSSRGFGEFAQQTSAAYIEDVFSTYLYTGNASTQTITNGIDLSTKGGLVWLKSRSAATDNALYDTARGATIQLVSNTANAQTTETTGLTSFLTNGFSIGALSTINTNAATYASWTFRKQPKFFDIVTYTGNGANRTISHNLGSVPGMILIKRTDTTAAWAVYHRSLANTEYLVLNTSAAKATGTTYWNSTTPTATEFSLGTATDVNANGGTYVAYIFAHNAGGFGLTSSDNVISCGSYTTDASAKGSATLGFEPQFIIAKAASAASDWLIQDVMRGQSQTQNQMLLANSSGAEYAQAASGLIPNATGFTDTGNLVANGTVIYMAIRRGPMRTPTSGTSVFKPVLATSSGTFTASTGFPVDLDYYGARSSTDKWFWFDRLRGNPYLKSNSTAAEAASVGAFDSNTSFYLSGISGNYSDYINYAFARAPGFFDVVCYTGTGSAGTVSHNLGVAPQLLIVKRRDSTVNWIVYSEFLGNQSQLSLNTNLAASSSTLWASTSPTSSVFSLSFSDVVNGSGSTYVAYLFATCPGVSSVGSYTGTGATQTISCGFTAGARFVLIKRTDITGDWWAWDTARGMVAGTDPRLGFNLTTGETNANWVYTTTGGFQIVTSDATINANGGSYIYLAIA